MRRYRSHINDKDSLPVAAPVVGALCGIMRPMDNNTISQPLKLLERTINEAYADVEAWFRRRFVETPAAFYCSVDLRNNGNKIAPIDTNLFPGGFNNIPPANHPLAAEALARQIDQRCVGACSVLLIAENHTRNMAYMDNIAALKQLLESAGCPVRIGRLDGQSLDVVTAGGYPIAMRPIESQDGKLRCDGAVPCLAILNNDLSGGAPDMLLTTKTPVLPPPTLGWARRRKSDHFFRYQRACEDFARVIRADPWLLMADFHICPRVNFRRREGLECLAAAVEETLKQILEKYRQHDISDEPYVVIKANAGTYGMGVLSLKHPDEVFRLNRRQRNTMSVGKEGVPISDVMIQEGIRTIDQHNGGSAEPVVYMVGGSVIGGFFRVNERRGSDDNLNSGGMSFSPLPFQTARPLPTAAITDDAQARLYVYGVIARLAAVAAAEEAAA